MRVLLITALPFSWLTDTFSDIPQSFLDKSEKFTPSPNSKQTTSTDSAHTFSATPNFYCPSGAFQGWKQVKLAGKRQSKSSTDLKRLTSLRDEWVWNTVNKIDDRKMDIQALAFRKVGLEDMPYEILGDAAFNLSGAITT